MSVDKVLAIAKTITPITVRLPLSGETITQTLLITERQKSIAELINEPL